MKKNNNLIYFIMKKIIRIVFVTVVIAITGYNIHISKSSDLMSALALANVEALAFDESDPIDPNTAYGYQYVNCYDKNKKIIGGTCAQVEDLKAECKYSSGWGKCN